MIDNRLRSDASGLDIVSVGNPHRQVARLLFLYTLLLALLSALMLARVWRSRSPHFGTFRIYHLSDKSKTSSSESQSEFESESYSWLSQWQHDPPSLA
jgi:hypothetical protein